MKNRFGKLISALFIFFTSILSVFSANITVGTANFNISAASAGGTAYTSLDNLSIPDFQGNTYTLTSNIQCVDFTLGRNARINMNGFTFTITGNLVINPFNGSFIDLGNGGQLLVTGSATIGSGNGVKGTGANVFSVGGALTVIEFNNTFVDLGASGTLKVGGNLNVGSGTVINVNTLEMNGCPQNIDVKTAFTISTFTQSSSCSTQITSSSTANITTTTYNQNGNAVNLRPIAGIVIVGEAPRKVWSGAGNNDRFTNGNNWVGGAAPIAGDALVFTGSTRLTPDNNFGSGTSFASIVFASSAGDFNIIGNNLTLSGGASAISNEKTSGTSTISLNITYSTAAPTITCVTGGTLNLSGTQSNGGFLITNSSAGTTNISGVISGTGGLTKSGVGTLTLSAANTYTGLSTISAGILKLNNTTALGTTAAGTSITLGAVLDLNGINYTASEAITVNGTGISNGGAIINTSATAATYGGLLTLGSSSSIICTSGNINITNLGTISGAGFGLTLGGAFAGVLSSVLGTTSGTLTKQDAGIWTLSGANTFTGGVNLNAGTLNINNATALGTGTFTIANNTVFNNTSGAAIIMTTNNAQTWNGDFTFTGSSSLDMGTGAVNLGSSTRTITISIASTLTIGGVVSGTGGITRLGTAYGSLYLTGSNTYSGPTTITSGILTAGNAAALGATSSGTVVAANGQLILKGFTFNAEPLTLNGNFNNDGSYPSALRNSLTGSSSVTWTGPITLGSDAVISCETSGDVLIISGVISGAFRLTKTRPGTLILTGSNTYSGGTTINTGSILQIGNGGTTGSIVGNVVNDGTLIFNRSDAYTFTGIISGTGVVIINGGTITLSGSNTYSGLTTVNAGTLIAGNGSCLGTSAAGTTINTGATFDVNGYNLGSEAFVLNGGTILNNGGSQTNAMQKLTVTANSFIGGASRWDVRNSGLASAGVTINAGVTLTKQDANYCYWVNIPVVNNGSLVINDGRVYLENGSATSGAGTYIVNSGTYLGLISWGSGVTLTNNVTVNNGFIISDNNAGGTSIITGNVAISGSLTVDNSVNFAISGIISGTGTFTKISGGILTISGANTYVGTTNINAGTLKLGAAGVIPDASAITITGTLDMNTFSETVGSITGGGLVDNSGGASSFTLTSGGNNTSTEFTGVIKNSTGTLAIAKAGSGTLTLSGTNTYAGITDVLAGVVKVNNTLALGSNGSGTIVYSGAALDLNGFNYTTAEPLTLNGTGISNGGALMNSVASTGTFTGLITLGSNASIIAGSGDINLTNTGTITGSTFGLTLGGAFNGVLTSILGTTTGSLIKQDAGTWTLGGTNTYTGTTTINAGILKLGKAGVISDVSAVTVTSPGTLDMNTFSETVGSIAGNGTIDNIVGAGTPSLIFGGNNSNTTFSGVIKNTTGTISVTKLGTGIQTLSGLNTYSGTTLVSAGTLQLGASGVIPDGSAVTVNSPATFDLNSYTETVGSIAGNGIIDNVSGAGSSTFLAGGLGTSTNFSGVIRNTTGSLAFTKLGAGTLTLSGAAANTFSGVTSVFDGTLLLQKTAGVNAIGGNITIGNASGSDILQLGANHQINDASVITFTSGGGGNSAKFNLNGYIETIGGITTTGTGQASVIQNVESGAASGPTSPAILTVNNTVDYTYDGIIRNNSGGATTLGLVKSGTATLTIKCGFSTGAINYLGSTTISAGKLVYENLSTLNTAITINSAVADALTFNQVGTDMSMSPVISGTGQLTKLGTGVLTLNNTLNSYSGNTKINAGILRLGASEVIPNSSAVVVTSPGTLDMNAFNETLGSIEGTGIVDNSAGAGTITLTVGGLNTDKEFSGIIRNTIGTLALTKVGTGFFRLSGNNTYSGITNINNGLVTAQHANALGATTGGTVVANGATLVLFDYTYPSENLTISGNGNEPKGALRTSTTLSNTTVTFPGNITLAANSQIGAEIASVQFNLTGIISGAFNLTKIADGVLTLSGANTYSGLTTVSVGTLKLNNTAALGTIASGTVVSSGAALDLNGINYSALETLSIAGTGVSSSGVLFNSNATAATFAGAITMTANSTITTSNQITLSGNITPNTLDLVKNGASTLSFVSNTASVRDLTLSNGTLNAGASTINISRAFTSTGTFTAGTSTVNFVGTANQTIPALGFYNATLNNSTGAVLGGDVSVGGTITLTSGVLTTGLSTVDLGANGVIVEATPNTHAPTSYVTGLVKSTRNTGSTSGTVTFGGLGLDITETTKTNNSTVVIRTTGTPKSYTLGATTYFGILRFFDITPANDVNLNGTMVMHYFDHELNGSTEANLRIYKDSTGGFIRKAQSVPSPASNSISLSGIKDFSLWTASDWINQPLPITLVRFVAEKNNSKQVDLKWTTASEIDNDFFTIEKSLDGDTWGVLGTVEGSGTTNETNNYSFIDTEVSRATVYYRLKQTDYDGKFEYSNVISVGSTNHSIECNLFPSPANVDNIKVLISTMELGEYNFSITNAQGLEMYNQSFNHEIETDIVNLSNEFSNLETGLYHLQISKDYDKVCDQKFILR